MSDAPKIVTAGMLVIGNEVLSGRTRDTNTNFIATRLTELGIRLREARVIPDDEAVIIASVREMSARFDYVFTSGGIGPTHDDITADCIAKAFNVPLSVHPEARGRLERHYPAGGLNEARLRMARVPEGGTLIDNPVSIAPGFRIGNVFVMAGVPNVMQAMFDSIRHELVGGAKLYSRTLSSFALEGQIASGLAAIQNRHADLEIGSYPFMRQGRAGASIVLRGTDEARLAEATEEVRVLMDGFDGEPREVNV